MKKKAILVVALLAIGMASALLVNYLSNTAEAEVIVTSPISNVIEGDTTFEIVGGETVSFNITTTNLASVPITGKVENLVTNLDNLTCDDFTSVNVTAYTNETYVGTWDLIGIGNCINLTSTSVQFLFGPQPTTTWIAGQEDKMEIATTFLPNAIGTYTFTSQVLV